MNCTTALACHDQRAPRESSLDWGRRSYWLGWKQQTPGDQHLLAGWSQRNWLPIWTLQRLRQSQVGNLVLVLDTPSIRRSLPHSRHLTSWAHLPCSFQSILSTATCSVWLASQMSKTVAIGTQCLRQSLSPERHVVITV